MKRLLLSILTVGLVSAGAFAATRAYFSDQATIQGAKIVAGTVDISLHRSVAQGIDIANLMPGVWTTPQRLEITNEAGSHPVKYEFHDEYVVDTIPGFYSKIQVLIKDGSDNNVFYGRLQDLQVNSSSILASGASHNYYFQFRLDPNTTNTFKGGVAKFNIIVNAVQQEGSL